MKLGGSAPAQAPTEEPAMAPADDAAVPELGNDVAPEIGGDGSSEEMPFEKEPFDAGVEADEQSDPKKYIEQLTGKLGQSLRTYTQNQGGPDFELEKFAINSLLSATHTSQMDSTDQADIINKVETSGRGSDGGEDEPQGTEEEPAQDDDADNVFSTDTDEPADDEDAMNEMALSDHNTQKLIRIYDNGDDKVRAILSRLVSFSEKIDRKEFLRDLQDEIDYDDIHYIFGKLGEMGIAIPEDEGAPIGESFMLENPPKNNMFQDGSNDKLEEANPCWQGYEQRGMKTKNGKEVPNCVKISENLEKSSKNGIFAKDKIKSKLMETFNQEDMAEPATQPIVKPTTKPETAPNQPVKPSRKNKPFLPEVAPGTRTQPKAQA